MIFNADCFDKLKELDDNSIDSVVTDPPYNIGFMQKKWDKVGINPLIWHEVFRVLKPGGYMLVFGGTRTYHRMVSFIEDAGFIIRDCISYVYTSGMPHGQNIGKSIEAKLITGSPHTTKFKELDGKKGITSLGYNKMRAMQNGTANYNNQIYNEEVYLHTEEGKKYIGWNTTLKPAHELICLAQKPISEKNIADNVLKYGTGGLNIGVCKIHSNDKDRFPTNFIIEEGMLESSLSKFFYCPKATKKEKGEGNTHPTVKPLKLMEYLVNLITPIGGTVLDPFMGSGTTVIACNNANKKCIGIEKDTKYFEIAQRRINEQSYLGRLP